MDPGTPSHIYLTICLYISFYFLFFTNPPLPPSSSQHRATGSDGQPYSSSSEDYFDRRAKSQSEQLDPFLAATRKATAIAKAQAKASVRNTIRNHSRQSSRQSSHSRQQSQHHHQRYSSGSQGDGILPSNKYSFHLDSFAHIRQKSNHKNTLNHSSFLGQATATSFTTPPSTGTSSHTLTNPIFIEASHQKQPHKHWQGYPFTIVNRLRERKHRSPRSFHPRNHPHNHQNPHRYYQQQQKQSQPYNTPGPSSFSLFSHTMQTPSIAPPTAPGALNTSPGFNNQEQVEEIKEIEELEREEQQHQMQQQQEPTYDPRPQHISITTEVTTPHRSNSDNANHHINNGSKTTRSPTGQGQSNGASTLNTRTRYEPKCRLEDSVTPPTLLAHLRFLRFLQTLVIVDDEDLDFLFLIRSEERYLMFLDLLQQLQPSPAQVPLPPLDVALMWTVHMLAPFRYHEDLLRSYSPHLLNYAFPLERYVAAIDIENATTDSEAFAPSKEMWYQLYPDESFDLDRHDTNRMFDIQCLWCSGTNIMDSSTFIKFRIDGTAIDCAGCGSQCSLETLSSKRLWDGIEAYRADSSILLAGSLLSPWSGTPDPIAAQREHHHLFFHPRIQFGLDQASVALNCSWPKVVQAFQDLGPDQYYGIRPTTLARIISSYMGLIEDRLSMDLVAGALRQRDFQKAMMLTGGQAWCQPQVLQRSLDRYRRFMLLARAEDKEDAGGKGSIKKGKKSKKNKHLGSVPEGGGGGGRHALVPTLDIDLAWHTHMLSPAHYRQYQLVHYGRVLNHDDSVQATSSMTKQDFIRTAKLWQDLYEERYSSQQWEVGRFVWTPEKICAGVCFPPLGLFFMWRSWKSKRAIKKSLKFKNKSKVKSKQKQGDNLSLEHSLDGSLLQTMSPDSGAGIQQMSSLDEKSEEEGNQETGLSLTHHDSQEIEDLTISSSLSEKGKGIKSVPLSPEPDQDRDTKRDSGSHGSSKGSPDSARRLTQAVGLDGRVSNWNGETAGPDGQASCSSGGCIMSPWNEVQDLAPYVEFQQQQQREMRNQRT